MEKAKFDVTDGKIPVSRINLGDILIFRGSLPWTKRKEHVIDIHLPSPHIELATITTARKKNDYFFYITSFGQYNPSRESFGFVQEQLYGVNTIGYEKARNGLINVGARI